MRSLVAASSLLSVLAVLLAETPRAQGGQWTVAFDHLPDNLTLPGAVHPSSASIASPLWVTRNTTSPPLPPHQRLNVVHACLIPSGVHRGEVLVWDGNLTNIGTRFVPGSSPPVPYQPWSIVNPYWPQPNPNFWPGMPAVQYRFHNSLLMTPQGEGDLFCAGHCWMADGRLAVAGGTKQYPIQTGYPEV